MIKNTTNCNSMNKIFPYIAFLFLFPSFLLGKINSINPVSESNCLSFVFIPSNYNGSVISCADASDGSLSINAFGGVAPYTYLWNDGFTGFEKNNLPPGNYSVTVSDANGCSLSSSINLQSPSPITASASVVSNYNGSAVSCINATDGIAIVSASGGILPFEYDWDNGNKFANADDLDCGVHTVTVTDANGCTAVASVNLICPPALNININITSDYNGFQVSCPETNDGAAIANPLSGIAPFQFEWSSGENTNQANNLIAGSNGLTVTDALGCSIVSFVDLSAPNEMQTFTSVLSNYDGRAVSCTDTNDGEVAVNVFGGNSPYTYAWDNGESDQTATQLSAGNHEVTITDASGCAVIQSFELDVYEIFIEPIIPANYNGASISCNGLSDGSIQMNVEAGASSPPMVNYQWNTGATSSLLENISEGTYTLTVTSDFGCSATAEATITEPNPLNALATIQSDHNGYNVSINGDNDGSASIIAAGGIPPYNFTWENGLTGNENNTLNGGIQNVSVTDANNCLTIVEIDLTQPSALTVATDIEIDYHGSDISCPDEEDGSAIAIPSGGVAPYTYLWSNNTNEDIVTDLAAGTHEVTITDTNGATAVSEIRLEAPNPISTIITGTPSSNPPSGTAKIETLGGTPPYRYKWNDPFQREGQQIDQLAPGWYRVTVTDANGCEEMDQIEIELSNEITCVKEHITVTPNGDGKNDLLNLACIHAFQNEIEIFDRWGNVIFTAIDYDGTWNMRKDGQNIPTGGYYYILSVVLPDGKKTMKGSLTIIR